MSRRNPSVAIRGSDPDELRPFGVSVADADALTDAEAKGRPIRNIVRNLYHYAVHDTIIDNRRPARQGLTGFRNLVGMTGWAARRE